MKRENQIIDRLRQEGDGLPIPDSLCPDEVRRSLELYEEWKETEGGGPAKKESGRRIVLHRFEKILATAACICLVIGGTMFAARRGLSVDDVNVQEDLQESTEGMENMDSDAGVEPEEKTYEEIYAVLLPMWEESGMLDKKTDRNESVTPGESGADSAIMDLYAAEESVRAENSTVKEQATDAAYGTTNVQTAGVDEGDLVKNDGRYLYQSIVTEGEEGQECAVQIVDTIEGLKEVARIGGFQNIREFYVWEDILIVIENKYMQNQNRALPLAEDMEYAVCDLAYFENEYHEITVIDISQRDVPSKKKTFTLQGRYESSRIADGYFYGFSRYYASPGEGAQDYDAYVPSINGKRLAAGEIFLPEEGSGTSYLVLVSLDLMNPTEFCETMAVASSGSLYYVSAENIYVTAPKPLTEETGWCSDTTSLMRFSYEKGRFVLEAEGWVKGCLNDSFSLDEYEDTLRVVSTVNEYNRRELVDDRTGETIGYSWEENRKTNGLYVLNMDLHVIGCVEGLAEDEQIYSARFLGDTGYFVTFRQVDPLFAVDLSNPERPQILSELKISGFSEYLHFYGKDRLLGIGMEADPETGRQQGMKLSMFDISNPADVREIAKLPLSKYNYSEALYNHRAVLIHPEVNIFGFEAEGSDRGQYWKEYLLFSYEDDAFVQRLKISAKSEGGYYRCRGTFIGDVFYLLKQDGTIESYNRKNGAALETLSK